MRRVLSFFDFNFSDQVYNLIDGREVVGIHNDRRIDDLNEDVDDLNWVYVDDYPIDLSKPTDALERKMINFKIAL